ncbi:MAG: tRNA (adenosine(37)-N6)-threonylcarbamoyltransferase complex ATPase subunit type 1 TsaE [Planctomycetota bacterium]
MIAEFDSASAAETESVGRRLGELLVGGELVCLLGELGAGKTVFVRGLAAALGCALSEVASPTYVLERVYRGERLDLRHLDAYRLSGAGEFEAADLASALTSPETVAALEWADRVEEALPAERVEVVLTPAGENGRKLSFRPRGGRYEVLVGKLAASATPDGPTG